MKLNIDEMLDRYWEGESSVEEEKVLKAYFQNDGVAEEHLPYQALFGWMDDQSGISNPRSYEIEDILARYWEGETSTKEVEILKVYFRNGEIDESHLPFAELFGYFDDQKKLSYKVLPEPKESGFKVKIFTFRKFLYAVAAVLVLVFGAVTVMQLMQQQDTSSKSAMVQEIEDPEEALRITKEALALVSSKFRSSQQSVRENLGALEKAAIFK